MLQCDFLLDMLTLTSGNAEAVRLVMGTRKLRLVEQVSVLLTDGTLAI